MSTTVLMTGAGGQVAGMIRPLIRERYGSLILSDMVEPDDMAAGESFRLARLDDPRAVAAACEGVDAIIHLGGQAVEADWDTVDTANIQGMMTLLNAAHATGVERVVFASSNHAIGMYPRHRRIGVEEPVRPDSRYGLSKAFGEAACALYADKHGLRCLNIRIGNVAYQPADLRRLSIWLHPEDLVQLCAIGIEHPDIHDEIVYGASENARAFWDNTTAYRLGYRPRHRAEDHVDTALEAQTLLEPDPLGDRLIGGGFATAEFDGDLERTVYA